MKTAELQEQLREKLEINPLRLEDELVRTPMVHSWVMSLLEETRALREDAKGKFATLKLDRWKYYIGRQTDEYYAKHGPFNESITKTEANMYVEADKIVLTASAVVAEIDRQIEILEHALKQVNSRAFLIREMIALRRFEAGLN